MFIATAEGRPGNSEETGRRPRRRTSRVGALCGGAAAAVLALALPAGAFGQSNFRPATNYANVGSSPYSIAVGDWNGDKDSDLAVANYFSDDVKVVLGDLGGGFLPMGHPDAGAAPSSVAVGDFNGDNDSDLAVTNQSTNKVSLLFGSGGYGFLPPTTVDVGASPSSVAVGNLNGDSHPDLAVANKGSGNVSVLLGNGDGSHGWFTAAPGEQVGASPRSVAVGNFNGDSYADLVVANGGANGGGDSLSVLLGRGTGDFDPASTPTVTTGGIRPSSVAVGDFDGDGKADDLAVTNEGSGNVSVRLGSGNGSFGSVASYGVGEAPVSVALGDFNGDKDPDLAVANNSINSNSVSVLLGLPGGGGFGSRTDYAAGKGPHSVAVGDFDYDSDDDLAVANQTDNSVSVLLDNRAPTATGDAYPTDQDKPLDVGAPGVLGNDKDPDNSWDANADQLTAALASGPAHGTLTLNANGSFHYTPNLGYSGNDSFSYTVSDGRGGWNVGTVSLTVKATAGGA